MTTRKATPKNVQDVYDLISRVDSSMFYKNTEVQTDRIIAEGLSIVAYEKKEPVGCILVCSGNTIDTIISEKSGIGSKMLQKLPVGKYYVYIHPDNEASIKLFRKFGFTHKNDIVLSYGVRSKYAGYIQPKEAKE